MSPGSSDVGADLLNENAHELAERFIEIMSSFRTITPDDNARWLLLDELHGRLDDVLVGACRSDNAYFRKYFVDLRRYIAQYPLWSLEHASSEFMNIIGVLESFEPSYVYVDGRLYKDVYHLVRPRTGWSVVCDGETGRVSGIARNQWFVFAKLNLCDTEDCDFFGTSYFFPMWYKPMEIFWSAYMFDGIDNGFVRRELYLVKMHALDLIALKLQRMRRASVLRRAYSRIAKIVGPALHRWLNAGTLRVPDKRCGEWGRYGIRPRLEMKNFM
jgi:hypothetical protein